jgi:hypothetical protein
MFFVLPARTDFVRPDFEVQKNMFYHKRAQWFAQRSQRTNIKTPKLGILFRRTKGIDLSFPINSYFYIQVNKVINHK